MEGQDGSPVDVGSPEAKTPEQQMKKELNDTILKNNEDLEGLLLTTVDLGGNTVHIFNCTLSSDSNGLRNYFGFSEDDGPVVYDKNLSEQLDESIKRGQIPGREMASRMTPVKPGELEFWQSAYARAESLALHKTERLRQERDLLPKALEFVKSRSSVTESDRSANLGGYPEPGS